MSEHNVQQQPQPPHLDNDDSSNVDVVATPPRKRPHTEDQDNNDNNDDYDSHADAAAPNRVGSTPPRLNKKRGRPPKNHAPSSRGHHRDVYRR